MLTEKMSLEKKRPKKKGEKESAPDNSISLNEIPALKTKKVKRNIKIELSELNGIQQDVLTIAKKVLKLKRYDAEFSIKSKSDILKYPIIEELYAKCIGKLTYNKGYGKGEIFLAIRQLDQEKWITTNERRTKLEILKDEKFRKVMQFIEKHPGIHARDDKIESLLEMKRSTFLYYIMTLERFKLIRSKKVGKRLHYFIADVPEDYDKIKAIFLDPVHLKVIIEVFKNALIKNQEIAEACKISLSMAQYHVTKLKELNLLKKVKEDSGRTKKVLNVGLLKKYNEFFKEPNFLTLLQGL